MRRGTCLFSISNTQHARLLIVGIFLFRKNVNIFLFDLFILERLMIKRKITKKNRKLKWT